MLLLLREKLVYTVMFFALSVYVTLNLDWSHEKSNIIETVVEKTEPRKQIIDKIDEARILAVECLATNMYFEARGESKSGQIAVAFVTLNRVTSNNFPDDICSVVYQAKYSAWWKEHKNALVPLRNRCQFSWYCDGKSDKVYNINKYLILKELAMEVLLEKHIDNTGGAVYYHADYVKPYWAMSFTKTTSIDDHVFYSE